MTLLLATGVTASVASPTRTRIPASAVFFGITVPDDDPQRVAAAAAAAGATPTVDGIFTRLDSPSFTPDALRAIAARGMTPLVTLEPWLVGAADDGTDLSAYDTASIDRGDHDGQLRHVARVVAESGVRVYLRYAHEMNGWWYPWAVGQNGNTAASYVAAWRHVAGVLRAGAGGSVQLVWAPAATTGSPREQDPRAAYPGDAWVDVVGMSAYGHGADPVATIDPTYRLLTSLTTRPVVLCEVGADGPDKRAWLAGFGAVVADRPQIRGFVWNNATPADGASGDYRFDTDPTDAAWFRISLRRLGLDRTTPTSPAGGPR